MRPRAANLNETSSSSSSSTPPPSSSPLTLRLSSDSIREETFDGLTVESWFLHSLADFEMLVRDPLTVHLTYNVTQKERRSRRYVLDGGEGDYFRLVSIVQPVLEAQAKSALTLGTLQCVKCQMQFTKESTAKSGGVH